VINKIKYLFYNNKILYSNNVYSLDYLSQSHISFNKFKIKFELWQWILIFSKFNNLIIIILIITVISILKNFYKKKYKIFYWIYIFLRSLSINSSNNSYVRINNNI